MEARTTTNTRNSHTKIPFLERGEVEKRSEPGDPSYVTHVHIFNMAEADQSCEEPEFKHEVVGKKEKIE